MKERERFRITARLFLHLYVVICQKRTSEIVTRHLRLICRCYVLLLRNQETQIKNFGDVFFCTVNRKRVLEKPALPTLQFDNKDLIVYL